MWQEPGNILKAWEKEDKQEKALEKGGQTLPVCSGGGACPGGLCQSSQNPRDGNAPTACGNPAPPPKAGTEGSAQGSQNSSDGNAPTPCAPCGNPTPPPKAGVAESGIKS